MVFQQDDFFYYLKIAANIARGKGSTFNGIVPTNGYHPLWLSLIALWQVLFPRSIQVFLALTLFASNLATFFLARRILCMETKNSLLATVIAAAIAIYAMHITAHGMEVVLTVPLMFAAALWFLADPLWQGSLHRSIAFGLLISALVLSRLDTVIFVVLLGLFVLAIPSVRKELTPAFVLGFTIGTTPIAGYLMLNRLFFHTWTPVSGSAKQLRSNHLPALTPWLSLFHKSTATIAILAVILFALGLLPLVWKRLTPRQKALCPAILILPFVNIFVLSCLSDWKLWDWYFYPQRIAIFVALLVLLKWPPSRMLLERTWATGAIAILVTGMILLNRLYPAPEEEPIYATAVQMREFAVSHPGVYAMGDRSGTVGYLLPDPVVQTEGLTMDKTYLNLVDQQLPLAQVLSRYHVDYYVASTKQYKPVASTLLSQPRQVPLRRIPKPSSATRPSSNCTMGSG